MDNPKPLPLKTVEPTPNDRTITVTLKRSKNSDHTSTLVMNLPEFIYRNTLDDLERTWRYFFRSIFENEGAMQELDEYLPALVQDAKTAWKNAGMAYSEGWRDPRSVRSKREAKEIKAANDEMADTLFKAAKRYEKYRKVLILYNRVKARVLH